MRSFPSDVQRSRQHSKLTWRARRPASVGLHVCERQKRLRNHHPDTVGGQLEVARREIYRFDINQRLNYSRANDPIAP